jgi:capsular polysaccharide transport system permease protein
MAGHLFERLRIQGRVIHALAVREFQTQQMQLAYGYGWVIFDMIMSMAAILIMRLAIRGFNRPGLPAVTLIISGLVPWSMFGSMYSLPEQAIQRNRRLLELPGVTPLDLVFAASLRVLCTYAVMYTFFVTLACAYDGVGIPHNMMGVILLFFGSWLTGLSLGFVLMVMGRVYPPAPKFTGFVLRFSTIASGVILLVTYLPGAIWPYLTWNPMLHVEELLHTYWLPAYVTPVGRPLYVLECVVGLTALGFSLERYARRRLPL